MGLCVKLCIFVYGHDQKYVFKVTNFKIVILNATGLFSINKTDHKNLQIIKKTQINFNIYD